MTVWAAVAVAAAIALVAGCGGGSDDDRESAIEAAYAAYDEAVDTELDLGAGPCIANPLAGLPDWVVDIAHAPREAVDDVEANQCSAYRSGDAGHFVELDPEGNLIRAE